MSGKGTTAPLGIWGIQSWCRLAFSGLLSGLLSIVTVRPRFVSTTVLPKGIDPGDLSRFAWPEAGASAMMLKAGSSQQTAKKGCGPL